MQQGQIKQTGARSESKPWILAYQRQPSSCPPKWILVATCFAPTLFTTLFITVRWSSCWALGLSHLQRCLWWTMHGKGVLFTERGLNLTAYQKVLLQGLQLGTTAHVSPLIPEHSPGGRAVNRDVSLTPPAAKPSWMLLPKCCLVFSARASGLLFQLPRRALWWICSVWLHVVPGPWVGMMLIWQVGICEPGLGRWCFFCIHSFLQDANLYHYSNRLQYTTSKQYNSQFYLVLSI